MHIFRNVFFPTYGMSGRYSPSHCWNSAIYLRQIDDIHRFESNWIVEDIYIPTDDISTPLVSKNDLYFYGSNTPCESMSITQINTFNGVIIAQNVISIPPHNGVDMVYSGDYIYIGHHGTGKAIDSSTEGAGGIIAYNVENNIVDWSKIISGTRGIRSLFANNQYLAIDSNFSYRYYLLDNKTGEVVSTYEKKRYLDRGYIATLGGNIAFWLNTIKSGDNVEFWSERLSNVMQNPTILDNGDILLRTLEGYRLGQIKRIDGKTGEIIWEVNAFALSNVVVSHSSFFYLSPSAELIAADIATGDQLGSVQFSPKQVQMGEDRGFYVAANENNQVFVYFGDSRQLFAFQFTPSPVTP